MNRKPAEPWTDKDLRRLRIIRRTCPHYTLAEIAQILDTSIAPVRNKLHRSSPAYLDGNRRPGQVRAMRLPHPFREPPAEVLAERDARSRAPADPIRELLGDPPPGRSALDRRLNGQSESPVNQKSGPGHHQRVSVGFLWAFARHRTVFR